VDAKKDRTCGHGYVRPGSALEGTRLNAGATKRYCAPMLFAMAGT
jgi:hypothetical protein